MTLRPSLILSLALLPVWAADVAAPGVPNFHVVNQRLYRGAQPKAEGWKSLAALGVKTVVDLRHVSSNSRHAEQKLVEAAGMRFVTEPMSWTSAPDSAQIAKILAQLDSSDPVFVHCRQGKDRTGTVIACYRIAHDGWSNQKALEEALSYGLGPWSFKLRRYILRYRASP